MPHVASPSRLLAAELSARRRTLAKEEFPVSCDGARHRIRFDGRRWYADDHDEAAEEALGALGGTTPECIRVVRSIEAATSADLWATFDPRTPAPGVPPALRVVPAGVRATLLATALAEEFADASTVVSDSVAQLGLALLGEGPVPVDALRTKFQLTRELPRWDPGPGPWSDKELVLLARCMRAAAGEDRPHLVLLPSDRLARHAVAKYAVSLLDQERFLSTADLRHALASTSRNVRALTALLVAQGFLVEGDGQYRVRSTEPARTASTRAGRRRR